MSRVRAWLVRLCAPFGRSRRERDFDDEMASHLQMHIDDNLRAGLSAADARRAALLKLGGVESVKEAHRDRRGVPLVEMLGRDVRYALRAWRRRPGFAVVAVLSLALGIGANTAIFSIVNALLLRALPIAAPDRLVGIEREANRPILSNPIWEAVRDRHLFQDAAAWAPTQFNLARGGEVDGAQGLWVSGDFFQTLGVQPWLGRLITSNDDRRAAQPDPDVAAGRGERLPDPVAPRAAPRRAPDATAVAVLSYGFWQHRYGGALDVAGHTVTLDGVAFTIVGVTPPEFFGAEVGKTFDVAVPLAAEALTKPHSMLDERSGWWLTAFARLKAGQTLDSAQQALRAIQPQLRLDTLPIDISPGAQQRYLHAPMALAPGATGVSDLRRAYSAPLTIVMVVVGVVLLIACVNLANLLLARADSRRHEMSVRLAIGASRRRLVGQLLVESVLLAFGGAAIGLFVAQGGSRLLIAQLSSRANHVALPAPLDWRVLAFTSLVAVVAALIFGLAPAWRATQTSPNDALATQGRTASGRTSWVGAALVSTQVALSLVLVVAAGLFGRTFSSLAHAPLGFDPSSLLIVNVNVGETATPPSARMPLLARVRDAIRAQPGVANATMSAMSPLAGQWDTLFENPDGMALTEEQRDVFLNAVGPEWFATYGIAVREGRALDAHDAATMPLQSAVLNRTAARRFFPGRSAVGQVLHENRGPQGLRPWTIVGVVDDAVYDSVRSGPPPTMYEPLTPAGAVTSLTFTVRAARDAPETLAKSVVAAVATVDPKITVTVEPLGARVASAMVRERLLAYLAEFFGGLALLLAALGLYGVVSYDTSRRQREIGIRLALGARSATLAALLARRVAWLVVGGVVIGLVISAWSARFVSALLFGLEPRDLTTFAGAAFVLTAVAAIAAGIPMRRATRLDPTAILREG